MFISNRDMMLNRFIVPTQHVDNYMREQRKRKKECLHLALFSC